LLASSGLGINDLDTTQQILFREMMPSPFQLVPGNAVEPIFIGQNANSSISRMAGLKAAYDQLVEIYPDENVLAAVKLHAYLTTTLSVVDNVSNATFESDRGPVGSPGEYTTGTKKLSIYDVATGNASQQVETAVSNLLISRIPNAPKQGALDFQSSPFWAKMTISGDKTVDDVVSSLAQVTHLELYADSNIGKDSVYISGDVNAQQTATDVVSALTLCLHGAWRKVGPAYVLTDDEAGLNSRQQFIGDVVRSWTNRLQLENAAVYAHLTELGWMNDLTSFPGDDTDSSRHQFLSAVQMRSIVGGSGLSHGDVSWKDLPAGVQSVSTQLMNLQDNLTSTGGTPATPTVAPDNKVGYRINIQTALELPDAGIMSFVKYPVDDSLAAEPHKVEKQKILLTEPVRALLCRVSSVDEVKKIIDQMPTFGFNTLLLNVFSNGSAYFPNSIIKRQYPANAAVLVAAIGEGAVMHVRVYANLDLFCWDKDSLTGPPISWPVDVAADVNVFGEASDRGVQRRLASSVIGHLDSLQTAAVELGPANEEWVSPLDPAVRKFLPVLVQNLAVVPGLAGIVFEDTAPPGYNGATVFDTGDVADVDLGLGYSAQNRLAFLRAHHEDPIDVVAASGYITDLPNSQWQPAQFDVSIPGFDMGSSKAGSSWLGYRESADLSLLSDCFNSAKAASPSLPLLMRERLAGDTIEAWNEPDKVDQSSSPVGSENFYNYVDKNSLLVFDVGPLLQVAPQTLPDALDRFRLTVTKTPVDGFVIDLLNDNAGADGLAALTNLSPLMATPKERQNAIGTGKN
jgi:hypothetical protein